MSDLMREEFEVAFVAEEVRRCGEGMRSSALYMVEQDTVNVRSAWWAWQASRECLVIKLPEATITGTWHVFGFVRGFRSAQKLMRTLYEIEINKVGVKTK